jgi:hypothetical protein
MLPTFSSESSPSVSIDEEDYADIDLLAQINAIDELEEQRRKDEDALRLLEDFGNDPVEEDFPSILYEPRGDEENLIPLDDQPPWEEPISGEDIGDESDHEESSSRSSLDQVQTHAGMSIKIKRIRIKKNSVHVAI